LVYVIAEGNHQEDGGGARQGARSCDVGDSVLGLRGNPEGGSSRPSLEDARDPAPRGRRIEDCLDLRRLVLDLGHFVKVKVELRPQLVEPARQVIIHPEQRTRYSK